MRWLPVCAWFVASGIAACSLVNAPEDPAAPNGGSPGDGGNTPGTGGDGGAGATGGSATPTCEDGEQNGSETDVDCGGSCGGCPVGLGCGAATDCVSGFCPADDGVCCEQACDALCMACDAAKTGGTHGVCAPATAASDPDAECVAEAPATCGLSGGCDGAATPACLRYAEGFECVPTSCTGTTLSDPSLCTTGVCTPGSTSSCGNYNCNAAGTACNTTCANNNDCANGIPCVNNMCNGCPPPSIEEAGYCWVIALNATEDLNAACSRIGKVSPGYTVVGLLWTQALMNNVTAKLGCINLGDNNCCATALWYKPATNECETHEFGMDFVNYGPWDPNQNVGVFVCNQ